MNLDFFKYQGTGNDFIIIDNFKNIYNNFDLTKIPLLCDRKFGIGADGIIFINKTEGADFEVDYYNSDGSKSFCGNGARCSVAFAKKLNLIKNKTNFIAIDGFHFAEIENDLVKLKMNNVDNILTYNDDYELNTGSPHYIKFVDNSLKTDVYNEGRKLRYSPKYYDNGINVNFVEILNHNTLEVATYERGVENETLSCGTGVVASAISYSEKANLKLGINKINIHTKGGHLYVTFNKSSNLYDDIYLVGPAIEIYKGNIII